MFAGRRIAVVEDDPIMGGSLVQRLGLEGAETIWLRHAHRALGAIRTPRAPIDAVICDIRLLDGSGAELYETLLRTGAPPPFLFITGQGEIGQAVRLLRAGAADYVTKPFEMRPFLERLALLLTQRPEAEAPILLGVSVAARAAEAAAARAAASDGAALIRGEAGVGKGRLAKRIHDLSDRRAAPFVALDFAREEEAAALAAAVGRAGEGTLLLAAIGRARPGAQARIAALLDAAPCRLIATAGLRLEERAAAGGFRADLLARLSAATIAIPPLRERPEDAVWLLRRLFEAMNGRRARPLDGVSALAEEAARSHDWPGSGRELRARLARAVAAAEGPLLQPADLFPERRAAGAFPTLAEARDAAERAHIVAALARTGGQVAEAARLLGISRTTLWEKMQRLGL